MVKSPCINVCELDNSRTCIGCGRTIDEIVDWSKLNEQEKTKILTDIKYRKGVVYD